MNESHNSPKNEGLTLSYAIPEHIKNRYYPRSQESFGEKLRAARIEAGFTRAKDLAQRIGVCKDSVLFWEQGRHKPTAANLQKIQDVLGDIEES